MILGRQTNLWLGAFTALFNVIALIAAAIGYPFSGEIVAGVNVAAAAMITLIANGTPTVATGSVVKVSSPGEAPDREVTVH